MKLNSLLRNRHSFTQGERADVWKGDSVPGTGQRYAVCRYCGGLVHHTEQWHIAHERAWSHWGSNRKSNLAVAHARCNIAAGNDNMPMVQRISLRTWLALLIPFALTLACGIAAIVLVQPPY